MATVEVAHIREQGQDMIIVPVNSEFGLKTSSSQHQFVNELQTRSVSAGLRGTVVPVWETTGGRFEFIAPRPWHAFFRSIDLDFVKANINRQLYW